MAQRQYNLLGRLGLPGYVPDSSLTNFTHQTVQKTLVPSPLPRTDGMQTNPPVNASRKLQNLWEATYSHRESINKQIKRQPRLHDRGYSPHYVQFAFSVANIDCQNFSGRDVEPFLGHQPADQFDLLIPIRSTTNDATLEVQRTVSVNTQRFEYFIVNQTEANLIVNGTTYSTNAVVGPLAEFCTIETTGDVLFWWRSDDSLDQGSVSRFRFKTDSKEGLRKRTEAEAFGADVKKPNKKPKLFSCAADFHAEAEKRLSSLENAKRRYIALEAAKYTQVQESNGSQRSARKQKPVIQQRLKVAPNQTTSTAQTVGAPAPTAPTITIQKLPSATRSGQVDRPQANSQPTTSSKQSSKDVLESEFKACEDHVVQTGKYTQLGSVYDLRLQDIILPIASLWLSLVGKTPAISFGTLDTFTAGRTRRLGKTRLVIDKSETFILPVALESVPEGSADEHEDPLSIAASKNIGLVVAGRNPSDKSLILLQTFNCAREDDVPESLALDLARKVISNSGWQDTYHLATAEFSHARSSRARDNCQQNSSGFITILRAWSILLGLGFAIRAITESMAEDAYADGLRLINQALSGHLNASTIILYLSTYGFIDDNDPRVWSILNGESGLPQAIEPDESWTVPVNPELFESRVGELHQRDDADQIKLSNEYRSILQLANPDADSALALPGGTGNSQAWRKEYEDGIRRCKNLTPQQPRFSDKAFSMVAYKIAEETGLSDNDVMIAMGSFAHAINRAGVGHAYGTSLFPLHVLKQVPGPTPLHHDHEDIFLMPLIIPRTAHLGETDSGEVVSVKEASSSTSDPNSLLGASQDTTLTPEEKKKLEATYKKYDKSQASLNHIVLAVAVRNDDQVHLAFYDSLTGMLNPLVIRHVARETIRGSEWKSTTPNFAWGRERWVTVPRQHKVYCGLHTALNAWAYILGITVDRSGSVDARGYTGGICLVKLAWSGRVDYRLVMAYMQVYKFAAARNHAQWLRDLGTNTGDRRIRDNLQSTAMSTGALDRDDMT